MTDWHAVAAHALTLPDTEPNTFWQTPHYANWPGLLAHFASPDPERLRRAIARAWRDRAKQAQRGTFGPRP